MGRAASAVAFTLGVGDARVCDTRAAAPTLAPTSRSGRFVVCNKTWSNVEYGNEEASATPSSSAPFAEYSPARFGQEAQQMGGL
jgi:hypothetical protein